MVPKLALFLLAGLPLAAETALALRDGEAFTFKVSWAVLPGAGAPASSFSFIYVPFGSWRTLPVGVKQ